MSATTKEPGKVAIEESYGPPYSQSQNSTSHSIESDADAYPCFIKWTIKIGTVILGFLIILMGVLALLNLFSFSIGCVFSGIILM